MAWIESHQELARHPKVVRLARQLKCNKAQAIGHLHLLWWWTLDFSPAGDLSAFTPTEIADAAEWSGPCNLFSTALRESGFLTQGSKINDWDEYAGKLIRAKQLNRERQKRFRSKDPPDTRDVTVTKPLGNALQDSTGQNSTKPRAHAERAREPVRLHGIPASVDEVIAYGATLNPQKSEATCREFWAHYEGQRQTNPSGDVFWITSGGVVVTAWKVKLPAFEGKEHNANHRQTAKAVHDRNAGTANAGKATQYRGVGKLV